MKNKLIERVNNELNQYLEALEKKTAWEVIGAAYEICWKNEFVCVIENSELSDEAIAFLLKLSNILDTLYNEWLHTDVSVGQMIIDVIDYIVKEEF